MSLNIDSFKDFVTYKKDLKKTLRNRLKYGAILVPTNEVPSDGFENSA